MPSFTRKRQQVFVAAVFTFDAGKTIVQIAAIEINRAHMIKTFADKHTRDLFITGKSKKFQPDILKRAIRRLEYIDFATCIEDLKVPPSNHLHALKDNKEGQYAISVNDQWRICFRFVNGDAYDVEITDYH